jgi:arylsulfatase
MKSKETKRHVSSLLTFATAMLIALSAQAQQITGTPGSPDATVTIDGKQLPPPPLPFGGVIKESAVDSKPYWPPRVVPPKGAPNILLIMTDDQGYGFSSTFGGVIPTPALTASRGRFALYQFLHRAVLAHAGGVDHWSQLPFGGLRRIPELSTDVGIRFRQLAGECHDRHDLKENGYSTLWFGKNHHACSSQRVRPRSSRGWLRVFLRLHGRRDRPMDTFFPRSHPDFPWTTKDYNLTTDLADEAKTHARPERLTRPAVLRLLRGRRHPSPHQPKPEWIEKFQASSIWQEKLPT